MRSKRILTLAVAAAMSFLVGAAHAADISPDAAASLGREFPDATFAATNHETINGVNVVWVDVSFKDGNRAKARLTESGDFLVSEKPVARARLPLPIKELDKDLFKMMPDNIDRYTTTQYIVDVENSGKQSRLIFDPVGRLRDVESGETIKHTFENAGAVVTDPKVRNDIDGLMRWHYGKKAQITTVDQALGWDNVYIVCGRNSAGEPIRAYADPNEVFISQVEIQEGGLPAPDEELLHGLFRSDKVVHVYRERQDFFEFDQPVRGNNSINFIIGPEGAVQRVTDEELANENNTVRPPKR